MPKVKRKQEQVQTLSEDPLPMRVTILLPMFGLVLMPFHKLKWESKLFQVERDPDIAPLLLGERLRSYCQKESLSN